MFYLENGRTGFYQWDVDQRLVVNHDDVTEVHFSNAETDVALICEVYEENGERYADVPNILLQRPLALIVYGCCGECVRASACFLIIARAKPDDYIYTETEVRNFETLQKQVNAVLDGLSPSFDRTEAFVSCHPVMGYPLKVISRIEGSLTGDGGVDPMNPYLLTGWDKVELYHGGKNLLDVSQARATENAPDTLNGAMIEGGMIDVVHQAALDELVIPLKVKRGVWHEVWCKAEVYDRPEGGTGMTMLMVEPQATQWTTGTAALTANGVVYMTCRFILGEEDVKDYVSIIIRPNSNSPTPAKVKLWPMVVMGHISVPAAQVEFEPYRGGEHVAEFGQGVYKGSFNWQTGELTTEWEHRVLDGSEDWRLYDYTSNHYFYLELGARHAYVANEIVCSHYKQAEIGSSNTLNGVNVVNSTAGFDRLIFRPDMSVYDTLGKWKAFLTAEYEAGHPVTVAYQRTEPKTVQLEPHELLASEGENLLYSTTGSTAVSGREDLTYMLAGLQMDGDVLGVVPEGEFELIETITFDGNPDVAVVERNFEQNGFPRGIGALWVEIHTACPDGTGRTISAYIYGKRAPSLPLNYVNRDYPTGVTRVSAIGVFVVNGMWFPVTRAVTSLGSQGTLSTDLRAHDTYIKGDDHIGRLKIAVNGGLNFPSDTIIKIWGVRANA